MSIERVPTLIWSPAARALPPVSCAAHVPLPARTRWARPRWLGRLTAHARMLANTRRAKKRRPKRCGSESRTRLATLVATSLRGHPQGAVEADSLAVEHRVLDDVASQGRELGRLPETGRERDLRRQRPAHLVGHHRQHRRVERPGRDGADPNAERG